MSIKKFLQAVVATVTLASGASAAVPLSASAATPACGPNCLSVFSPELGTYAHPNFVEHVFGGTASIGQPTGLNTASRSDSSEDFINPHPGTVSDYYAMGLVSAEVNRHYGSLTASQLEYAPSGTPSGLCVAVASDPSPDLPGPAPRTPRQGQWDCVWRTRPVPQASKMRSRRPTKPIETFTPRRMSPQRWFDHPLAGTLGSRAPAREGAHLP
jgi:hypothetical protein